MDDLSRSLEERAETVEPIELERKEWQPFPIDALPEPVRSFVRETARSRGVDEAMVAVPLLGILAGLVGNARRLRLSPEFVVPAVLWTCVLAESGTGKTPAVRAAAATLDAIDAKLRVQSEHEQQDHEAALERWNACKPKDRGEKPRRPPQRQAKIDDATSEALLYALADNPRGLVHATDELAGTLLGFDQYRPRGKGNDAQRYLRMYDAADVTLDRAKGGTNGGRLSLSIPRAALSIGGAAQPTVFARAVGRDGRENGLLARMLVAMPPELEVDWAQISHAHVPSDERMVEIQRKLATLDMPNSEAVELTLSTTASVSWAGFYNPFRRRRRDASSVSLRAHFAKLEGACARIALVLHLVRGLAGDPTLGAFERVDGSSIDAAARLVLWFAREAERVYAILDESPKETIERRLLEWIEQEGGEVSPSDLVARGPRPRPGNVAEAQSRLDGLVSAGLGAFVFKSVPKSGGRCARVFRLHSPGSGSSRCSGDPENGSSASTSTASTVETHEPASEPAATVGVPREQHEERALALSDSDLASGLARLSPEQRERWIERAGMRGEGGFDRATADRLALADVLAESGALLGAEGSTDVDSAA